MSHARRIFKSAGDERGAVLVSFAVFAPVAILLVAFALDSGNWFLHKRHLQLQADASALAAAQEFQPCVNEAMYKKAGQYGGVPAVETSGGSVNASTPLYNAQVGGTSSSNIHERVNYKTYFGQSSPIDSSASTEPPCAAQMVDVKLTESNLPWYWKALAKVPYINAHARVEVLQASTFSGVSPLAVTESSPVSARAYFVNEDSGNEVIKNAKNEAVSVALENLGPNAQGQDVWANSTAPLAVPLKATNATTAHIGVVVALSGSKGDTTCGHEYVECFGRKSEAKATLATAEPLLHIAGYTNAGTGTLAAPLARRVTLSAVTCTDAYFSNSASSCSFSIAAKVDYGSAVTKGVTVTPEVKGTKGTALTFNAGTGLWSGNATLPAGSGSNEITLVVKCVKETTSACPAKATEATVKEEREKGKLQAAVLHRIFAANSTHAGTISGAWLSEVGGAPQDADTFEVCASCSHSLVVTVDVEGSLSDAQKFSDPVFHMRFGNSQSEVVGCPPPGASSGAVYRENLAKGCKGRYKINTSDPGCTATGEPYDCIGFASGVKTGPFSQGLSSRLESEPPLGVHFYCPNNWSNTNGGGVPNLPKDDSRVVQVFIEPYDSNGSSNVPIQDFATFYVTGWDGDGCKSSTHPDDATSKGEIVGHFVKYVNTLNTTDGGGQKCTLNSLGECVTVLTR